MQIQIPDLEKMGEDFCSSISLFLTLPGNGAISSNTSSNDKSSIKASPNSSPNSTPARSSRKWNSKGKLPTRRKTIKSASKRSSGTATAVKSAYDEKDCPSNDSSSSDNDEL